MIKLVCVFIYYIRGRLIILLKKGIVDIDNL